MPDKKFDFIKKEKEGYSTTSNSVTESLNLSTTGTTGSTWIMPS